THLPGRAVQGGAARILAKPVRVALQPGPAGELAVVALGNADALAADEVGLRAQAVAVVDHAVAVVVEVVALLGAFRDRRPAGDAGADLALGHAPRANARHPGVARLAAALARDAADLEHLVVEVAVVSLPAVLVGAFPVLEREVVR